MHQSNFIMLHIIIIFMPMFQGKGKAQFHEMINILKTEVLNSVLQRVASLVQYCTVFNKMPRLYIASSKWNISANFVQFCLFWWWAISYLFLKQIWTSICNFNFSLFKSQFIPQMANILHHSCLHPTYVALKSICSQYAMIIDIKDT